MKQTVTFIVLTALLAACDGGGSRRAEIEARRAALANKQDSTLLATQQQLAVVDSTLEAVKREHDRQHEWVMAHATELSDQSPEVTELNRLRARRDSLEAEWQTLGAKIRYIRRLQENQHQDTIK